MYSRILLALRLINGQINTPALLSYPQIKTVIVCDTKLQTEDELANDEVMLTNKLVNSGDKVDQLVFVETVETVETVESGGLLGWVKNLVRSKRQAPGSTIRIFLILIYSFIFQPLEENFLQK